MKNPEIRVQVDDSMPLIELIEESTNPNKSIKRSAHIGNMFGADLILASMGMNMLLVDANYGERDKLYFPHLVVDEDQYTRQIACPSTLSLANMSDKGVMLNDVCTKSISDAFGNNRVRSDSEFVAENQSLVEEIVATLLPKFGRTFSRRITPSGRPTDSFGKPITIDDVLLLGDDPSVGSLIPNAMNILIDFAVEASKFGTDSITHISGPTMAKYIGGIMPQMQSMYAQLVDAGIGGLPDVLSVTLVPAAGVRFVISASQASDLDELLALQDELDQVTKVCAVAKKNLAMSGSNPCRDDFAKYAMPERLARQEVIKKRDQIPQLLYVASPESNNPVFTSQYSALRNGADGTPGSGLYIPQFALEQPIKDVASRFVELERMK